MVAGVGERRVPPEQLRRSRSITEQLDDLLQAEPVDLGGPRVIRVGGDEFLRGVRVVLGRRERAAHAPGAIRRPRLADQLEGRIVGAAVDRLVDAGGREPGTGLEDRANSGAQQVAGVMPGARVVRQVAGAGVAVEEDVADDAVTSGSDAAERAGVVDQRDARELGDRSAGKRAAPLEQPGDVGQRSAGGELEQIVAS